MTIQELLSNLSENLTDEQKAMDACFLSDDGNVYTVDTIMTLAVSASLPEGQTIMAALGTAVE